MEVMLSYSIGANDARGTRGILVGGLEWFGVMRYFLFAQGKFRTSGESIPFRNRERIDEKIFEILFLIVVNYLN